LFVSTSTYQKNASFFLGSHQGSLKTAPKNLLDAYPFGFNGKEHDPELKGKHNVQDYGFRMNDTRTGRFFTVDPLREKYPMLSTYQFASNTPIWAIDFDGLEACVNPRGHSLGLTIHACEGKPWQGIKREVGAQLAVAAPLILPIAAEAVSIYALVTASTVVASPELIIGGTGLVCSLIDPNPAADYPGGFDDLAKGVNILVKGSSNKLTKFIINTNKFDYLLGTLPSKAKPITELSDREIENLAKSNLRSEVFKKMGVDSKSEMLSFINGALKDGVDKELPKEVASTTITKVVTRVVDNVNHTFNVSFEKTKEGLKFTTISIPEANKNIKNEVKRLKTN
jgi:RHS repeat-associated protein